MAKPQLSFYARNRVMIYASAGLIGIFLLLNLVRWLWP